MAYACEPQLPTKLRWEIAWAEEFKAEASCDHTAAFQPGWQNETPSLKKYQKKERKKEQSTNKMKILDNNPL